MSGIDAEAKVMALAADFLVRAEAGRRLATFVGDGDADALLLRLLLDQEDTWVTSETTEALLEHGGAAAVSVLLRAVAAAEEDTFNKLSDRLWGFDWSALRRTANELAEREPALRPGRDRLLAYFDGNRG